MGVWPQVKTNVNDCGQWPKIQPSGAPCARAVGRLISVPKHHGMKSIVESPVCGRMNVYGRMGLRDAAHDTTAHNGVFRAGYKDENP